MLKGRRHIAFFLVLVMLVVFAAGSFNVQESFAENGIICYTPYGNFPGDDLNHAPAYANYTKRYGIDVSAWQGNINWQQVKAAGVDFAFIRVGVRSWEGPLSEDAYAAANILGALNAGIKVGLYVYSQAINVNEAIAEADLALNILSRCGVGPGMLAMPIAFDVEYGSYDGYTYGGRLWNAHLSKAARTQVSLAFLDRVAAAGYRGCLYSGYSIFAQHDMSQIVSKYQVWIAAYMGSKTCPYYGYYNYWQYSCKGRIPGIIGDVDLNVWYDPVPAAAIPEPVQLPQMEDDKTDEKVEEPKEDEVKAEEPKTDDTKTAALTSTSSTTTASDKSKTAAQDQSKTAADKIKTTTKQQTTTTNRGGWHYLGGNAYYTNPTTGYDVTGVQRISGNIYYFSDTGIMQKGWQRIGGNRYYFNEYGCMLFGWRYIDDSWFLFDGNTGAMLYDTWVDGYYLGPLGIREGYYKYIWEEDSDISKVNITSDNLIKDVPIVEDGVEYNLYSDMYMR